MLPDFVLSDEITSLPNNLFHTCTSIRNVRLPAKLQKMGSGVFWYCSGITNVVPYIPYALSGTIPDYVFCGARVANERLYLDNPNITGFGADPFSNNQFQYVDLSKTQVTALGTFGGANGRLKEMILPKTFAAFAGTTFHSYNGANQAVDVQFRGDVPQVTATSDSVFYNTSTSTKFLFRADYSNESWHEFIETHLDKEVDCGDGTPRVYVRKPTSAEVTTFKSRYPGLGHPTYMLALPPYGRFGRYVYFKWMPAGFMILVR